MTVEVTVQKGINPFTGKAISSTYDLNGFLLGRSMDTEQEALNEVYWADSLVVVNRTEINW